MTIEEIITSGATSYQIPIGGGCDLILTAQELRDGLDPRIWAVGLKRGKAIRRRRQYQARELKRGTR